MLKLSSTSALVMLWVQQECYQTKAAVEFLKLLDLDEGKVLHEQCNQGFEYSEVISNRKFGVMHLAKKCIADYEDRLQIVLAGAGFDALGIELTDIYPNIRVFELDLENMTAKSELAARSRNIRHRIPSFIEVDLVDTEKVIDELCIHGWDRSSPTLLVLEGISYYLPTRSLRDLVQVIHPEFLVFEFLKLDDDIAQDRLHIPQRVFGIVSQMCRVERINKFNRIAVTDLFEGMYLEAAYSMLELEKMRTGTNVLFPAENSGWIEVCLLRR